MTRSDRKMRFIILGLGIIVRLLCIFLADNSTYFDNIRTFVTDWVNHPFINPWETHPSGFFPYGGFPLLLFGLPLLVISKLFSLNFAIHQFLADWVIKLEFLAFDFALLKLFDKHFLGNYNKRFQILYWLNPIQIYISYYYGHTDLISMYFLCSALVLLFKDSNLKSGAVMGLATLCKFHVSAVIPLFIACIYRNNFFRKSMLNLSQWLGAWAVCVFFGYLPNLIANKLGQVTFLAPEAQRLLGAFVDFEGGGRIYLGVLAVLGILFRLILSRPFGKNSMIFGIPLIFGSILFMTRPMPNWYLWITPFLSLFFTVYRTAPVIIFTAFFLTFFGEFTSVGNSVWHAIGSPFNVLSFTFMQVSLGGCLVVIWTWAIRDFAKLILRQRGYLIGIAGDSGAGKDRLSEAMVNLFSPNSTSVIHGDDYHRWERGHEAWNSLTHLNPTANSLVQMARNANMLRTGRRISWRRYNHETGKFDSSGDIRPTKTIIIQGLHALHLKTLRNEYDISVFLNPDKNLRTYWKIQRDVTVRGHSLEKVLTSMQKRSQDAVAHISPQSEFADVVIEMFCDEITDPLTFTKNSNELKIGARYHIWNDIDLEVLNEVLNQIPGCSSKLVPCSFTSDRITLEFNGKLFQADINHLASTLFPELRSIVSSRIPPQWQDGLDGLSQIMVLAVLGQRNQFEGWKVPHEPAYVN